MKVYCAALYLASTLLLLDATRNSPEDVSHCEMRFEDTRACVCATGNSLFLPVHCKQNSMISIKACYCIHYDLDKNMTLVAHCYYTCNFNDTEYELADNSTELNDNICLNNRVGPFCAKCNASYGLPVYSYETATCVPCEHYGYKNWLKYFAVALLPLTVFYILAMLLRLNVPSSTLGGLVLLAQCVTSLPQVEFIVKFEMPTQLYRSSRVMTKIAITMFSIFNLDFLRFVYSPFCLHPKATALEILSLDYIVALYPFLLIFLTYVLVRVYDREYKPLLTLCRPFNRRWKNWNIRARLPQVFATFLLLSYVKVLVVSLEMLYLCLSTTSIYNVAGERVSNKKYTIYNANREYLSAKHLPFAALATIMSFTFVLLPLLLLTFYPCKCFQRCLNLCGGRCQPLRVFMDVFQGHYKTQPQDLRSFSALYLLIRILILIQRYIYIFDRFPHAMLYTSGMVSLAGAALVTLFQPLKVQAHNRIDSVLLLMMGVYFLSCILSGEITIAPVIMVASLSLSATYFFSLIVWKLFHIQLKAIARKIKGAWTTKSNQESIESFPRDLDSSAGDSHNYPALLESHSPTYS